MPKKLTRAAIPPRHKGGAARGIAPRASSPPAPAAPRVAAAVETLQEQAQRLGLLDPLDAEPAHIFIVAEHDS